VCIITLILHHGQIHIYVILNITRFGGTSSSSTVKEVVVAAVEVVVAINTPPLSLPPPSFLPPGDRYLQASPIGEP